MLRILLEQAFCAECPYSEKAECGECKKETLRMDKKNINLMSKEELISLPHIDEKRAEDILYFIRENGHFESLSKLARVHGISDKIAQDLAEFVFAERRDEI